MRFLTEYKFSPNRFICRTNLLFLCIRSQPEFFQRGGSRRKSLLVAPKSAFVFHFGFVYFAVTRKNSEMRFEGEHFIPLYSPDKSGYIAVPSPAGTSSPVAAITSLI